jgi:serine/threonine-protein kinase HipA
LIEDGGWKYIAKFSSSTDLYNLIKAEFIAMRLASLCGLNAAPVSLKRASNKDVLLIERFDREPSGDGWRRKCMISALTLLGLNEMEARYASCQDLAEIVRHRFRDASATLRELFGRIVFNILTGNTDDHARNHSAFWDGEMLSLTPAYDICPQAMLIHGDDRMSRLSTCLDAAQIFLLSEEEALAIVAGQIEGIAGNWGEACGEAGLSEIDRNLLWGRQFLNPFAFYDLEGDRAFLKDMAEANTR